MVFGLQKLDGGSDEYSIERLHSMVKIENRLKAPGEDSLTWWLLSAN